MDIITVKDLVKRYGPKAAVDGLSMTVREGEVFGFLGPNGAGKTTTVRMLTKLTLFDSGVVTVDGHDLSSEAMEAKLSMGVIQQHISLDKDLTVWENLMQHAMYHKIPGCNREARIRELVGYVGLDDYLDYMVNSISGGWKKRVAIVCSLLHRPRILFLDEPTVGLDIQARRMLWGLIRRLNRDGTTIFLTTHYIEEAEALCDRVGIIDQGRLIAIGTPKELCGRLGSTAVEYCDADGRSEYRYFDERASANEFAGTIGRDGTVIIRTTNLEDCFVELTGKKVGDA